MSERVVSSNSNLVTFSILIDGKTIPDVDYVTELHVENQVNCIPSASITVADGSAVDEDFAASASRVFEPGGKIEIKLGYHAKNKTVFEGIILRQNIRLDSNGQSCLVVGCHDAAIKTTLNRTSVGFEGKTDSEAISAMLRNSGLGANVEKTKTRLDYQVKHFATDWDFIRSRAEANGQIVLVKNGTVSVAKPDFSRPRYVAGYGDTINQMDLQLSAINQLTDVKASAWDPTLQKIVSGTSSEPSANKQGNITGSKLAAVLGAPSYELQASSNATQAELKDWADAQLLKSRLARIRGSVEFGGNADIDPGDLLDLDGLGKRFDGSGYVAAVRHDIEEGNWTTQVRFGLSPHWSTDVNRDVTAPPAGGLRPGISGLQVGKVLQIHDDPTAQRRIKIALPLSPGVDDGLWVRSVSPYASSNAGMAFMPEIGDEVVIGFLGSDPDSPVILGSLHSSARPAPAVPDESNTIKTIVTREQLKLSFDDDKKIVALETPGGHIIRLSDEHKCIELTDSNHNTVKMNETGIEIDSSKDIKISASGSVSITGQSGVTVESSADAQMKGANVSIEAQASLTARGGASAELSASGQTTVKGAMVLIN